MINLNDKWRLVSDTNKKNVYNKDKLTRQIYVV